MLPLWTFFRPRLGSNGFMFRTRARIDPSACMYAPAYRQTVLSCNMTYCPGTRMIAGRAASSPLALILRNFRRGPRLLYKVLSKNATSALYVLSLENLSMLGALKSLRSATLTSKSLRYAYTEKILPRLAGNKNKAWCKLQLQLR